MTAPTLCPALLAPQPHARLLLIFSRPANGYGVSSPLAQGPAPLDGSHPASDCPEAVEKTCYCGETKLSPSHFSLPQSAS